MNLGIPQKSYEFSARVKLAEKHLPEVYDEIMTLRNSSKNENQLSQAYLKLMKDERLEITEFDRIHLIMGGSLGMKDNVNAKTVNELYASDSLIYLHSIEELINEAHQLGRKIVVEVFPVIRAKLACKEILASWIGVRAVPHLLSITHHYMACHKVLRHVSRLKSDTLRADEDTRTEAVRLLKQVSAAITGNLKRKREKYPAVYFAEMHRFYVNVVIRARKKEARAIEYINTLASGEKPLIDENLKSDILYRDEKPESLALEMMQQRFGEIDERTFKTKLLKKNQKLQAIKLGNNPFESDLYFSFMDYRYFEPQLEHSIDYWTELELTPCT